MEYRNASNLTLAVRRSKESLLFSPAYREHPSRRDSLCVHTRCLPPLRQNDLETESKHVQGKNCKADGRCQYGPLGEMGYESKRTRFPLPSRFLWVRGVELFRI